MSALSIVTDFSHTSSSSSVGGLPQSSQNVLMCISENAPKKPPLTVDTALANKVYKQGYKSPPGMVLDGYVPASPAYEPNSPAYAPDQAVGSYNSDTELDEYGRPPGPGLDYYWDSKKREWVWYEWKPSDTGLFDSESEEEDQATIEEDQAEARANLDQPSPVYNYTLLPEDRAISKASPDPQGGAAQGWQSDSDDEEQEPLDAELDAGVRRILPDAQFGD